LEEIITLINNIFSLSRWITHFFLTILLFFSVSWSEDQIHIYSSEDSVFVYAQRYRKVPHYNTIATKSNISLLHTPANVGVVTGSMMRNQSNVVLGDALNNISGINPQTG
jgi:outer membrane receptor for ferric coprogen and ferric-rhodotorulic acid